MTTVRGAYSGVTQCQMEILTLLARREHWSVGEIAVELGVSSAAATKAITRLEKRGLVTRSVDLMDRRCVQVRLTRAAGELLRQNTQSVQSMEHPKLDL